MNKKILPSLLMLSVVLPIVAKSRLDSCDCEITGRSYMSVRPNFQSSSPEMVSGFRSDRMHAREDGWGGTVQFVLFGGKSTKRDDTKRFFTPFCKTELITDNSEDFTIERDLFTNHFNIFYPDGVNFRSQISFDPEQSAIGLGIHYRQAFWQNEEKGRALWFSVSSPIMRVKNNMNLKEVILEGADAEINEDADVESTVQANMTEALQQQEWQFGKIDSKSRSETKLADIEVKLGYEWLQQDPYHLESYVGVLIPTGTIYDGKFLFDAVVGNGRHAAVMFGSAGGFRIWSREEEDRSLRIEYATHSEYLFQKTQTRSFDLKGKPWSRYMEVYRDKEQAQEAAALAGKQGQNLATPGINVFTQKVDVRPGFQLNVNTAFVYTSNAFQGEVGYNFFARRAECIKLNTPWQEGPALKHLIGAGNTNPIRDITGNRRLEATDIAISLANYDNNIIKEDDLDLVSASHPCHLSHTIYGALGYRWDEREYPLLVNGGASYEFSTSNNAVLQRWTLWGKFGFSF